MTSDPDPQSEALQPQIISVRSLVEFVMLEGDLTPGDFQRRDRAQAGTQAHKWVQQSRPEGYQTEVGVAYQVEGEQPPLEIRGRIDGLYVTADVVILEEIKSTTLSLDLIEEQHNRLHWAQAQCYAYMYARQEDLDAVGIHLTYYQLDSEQEKTFRRHFTISELKAFFNELVWQYLDWFRKLRTRQARRNQSIQALDFPYDGYRQGQREMAVAVYRSIRDGERLYVQAPTGVGKTIATLFPTVKAIGEGLADSIFYLTAKTPGRLVAEQALDDLRQAGLDFRSVTLTAKEKICFCPPVNCDPEECPYARNYFGKVKTALVEIDNHQAFTRLQIEEIARAYEICPFEFSLDLALWVDCIICDYNYAFDPRVYLRRGAPSPAGTISLTTYFHADEAELSYVGDDFVLCRAQANRFSNGFFDQSAEIWSRDGRLLVTTHQLVYFKT